MRHSHQIFRQLHITSRDMLMSHARFKHSYNALTSCTCSKMPGFRVIPSSLAAAAAAAAGLVCIALPCRCPYSYQATCRRRKCGMRPSCGNLPLLDRDGGNLEATTHPKFLRRFNPIEPVKNLPSFAGHHEVCKNCSNTEPCRLE